MIFFLFLLEENVNYINVYHRRAQVEIYGFDVSITKSM